MERNEFHSTPAAAVKPDLVQESRFHELINPDVATSQRNTL